jgi:hypothetical protein
MTSAPDRPFHAVGHEERMTAWKREAESNSLCEPDLKEGGGPALSEKCYIAIDMKSFLCQL